MTIKHFSRGFSLVELMVGIVIALLGSLVITQVFSITEQSKQTTTSGSDAQQNGALAMLLMDKDLRQAGYGMNVTACSGVCPSSGFMGGTITINDSGARSVAAMPFVFAPILIVQGAANAPDTIIISYGNASNTSVPEYLRTPMAAGSYDINVNNIYGFSMADVMVVADATTGTGEVIQFSGSDTVDNRIKHESGSYQLGPVTQSFRYNDGSVAAYPINSLLFNLGQTPVNNIYSIVQDSSGRSNLVQTNNMLGTQSILATDIVDLQAEYGKDMDNDGVIETWDTVTPTGANVTALNDAWMQVKAIRYGLVARSIKREAACNVTTSLPVWRPDGVTTKSFSNISTNSDWQCYRYRVFETTNVLRNLVWNPE
ncbi:type IV pilus assembly protein PilW [Methylovorus glucosotrophus]|uniref:PilW family protein n=1 Tax=Methylovorus glucosotrophus TaxID=266009 RepID=UPI00133157ED|nr:PilW family protein [Methylovorus glucosotrophus]KAF0842906.1 type IV pilus assembly protein PilW [Methylovorus glucosotrophus]